MVLGESIGSHAPNPKTGVPAGQDEVEPPAAAGFEPFAIDTYAGNGTPLDNYLETIIHSTVSRHGLPFIISAKEAFFNRAGMIFSDDENYHHLMSYFLNAFLFETELPDRSTPFSSFRGSNLLPNLIDGYAHSLYKILKVKPDFLLIKDLVSNKKIRVGKQEGEVFEGIAKGDIFQGFILLQGPFIFLSRGLIFHPKEAHKTILRMVKGSRGTEALLFQLARLQLKHRRLKHVDPKLVYSENSQ